MNLNLIKISIENIENRYKTALYSYELYKNLHRTLDSKIHKKEGAERNCKLRNDLVWILGENTEIIFFHHAIFAIYSLYEETKWNDVDSVIELLNVLEENLGEINKSIDKENSYKKNDFSDRYKRVTKKWIGSLKKELFISGDNPGKYLKDYRHQLGHHFKPGKRKSVTLNTRKIEKILHVTGIIINKISSRFPGIHKSTDYSSFGREIQDDYRKLFFFLDRQNQVADIFKHSDKSDDSIIGLLNKIYRPYLDSKS